MRYSIRHLLNNSGFIVLTFLVGGHVCAAHECRDTNGRSIEHGQCAEVVADGTDELPKDAAAEIYNLDVEMRFYTAIGFHKQSGERRDAIVRIYNRHGVALPEQYKD